MNLLDACPKIYFGPDSLDALAELPAGPVLVLCDPYMAESGAVRQVTGRLERFGRAYSVFSEIEPDPSIQTVAASLQVLFRDKPESVVALGGGSAIDTAKAALYVCLRYKEALMGGRYIHRPFFVAVPTTSGSGSEVTSYAVLTDRADDVKIPLSDRAMIPDVAILDPSFTKTLPAAMIAYSGMDALTHAVEAYVSRKATVFTDLYAAAAAQAVCRCLPRLYAGTKDDATHQDMMLAATMAGLAFHNSSLGVCHGLAHTLGAEFHLPHGKANSIILPWVIAFNAGLGPYQDRPHLDVAARYGAFARLLGAPAGSDEAGTAWLIGLIQKFNVTFQTPASLRLAGISQGAYEAARADMTAKILRDLTTKANPVPVTAADVCRLLADVYEGGGPL
ncbi:MAG: iron-containing alcohol dehydrogenase [Propionibacteriaceae bacterium]|jgi:acetaldehyde dehydrogenase/alcohol dehydrogenase|nr:iron-containing alcohol dehydrogenase [Propionibacteriaceae bacterium]